MVVNKEKDKGQGKTSYELVEGIIRQNKNKDIIPVVFDIDDFLHLKCL